LAVFSLPVALLIERLNTGGRVVDTGLYYEKRALTPLAVLLSPLLL